MEQEMEATGHVVMCRACSDIQSRFVIAMPRRAKQARDEKQDDLLGGQDEASAAESGDEASTVSSGADPPSSSEAEAQEKKAMAQLSASTALRRFVRRGKECRQAFGCRC